MGRPATGSIRERADVYLASVPDKRNAPGRCECSFDSCPAAERWVDQQLARKARGLPPLKPRRGAVASPTSRRIATEAGGFGAAAFAWHAEHYDELLRGGPGRAKQVERDLTEHLVPVFKNLLSTPVLDGRQLLKDWVRVMSGHKALGVGSTLKVGSGPMPVGRSAAGSRSSPWCSTPVGKEKQPAPIVSIATTARIAAHMHVPHQLVLWLLRIEGLRISEVYGSGQRPRSARLPERHPRHGPGSWGTTSKTTREMSLRQGQAGWRSSPTRRSSVG